MDLQYLYNIKINLCLLGRDLMDDYLDPELIASELGNIDSFGKEQYGLSTTSFIWQLLNSIKINNTLNLKDRTSSESAKGETTASGSLTSSQGEKLPSTLNKTDKRRGNIRKQHSQRIDPRKSNSR